ncbi:LytTR family DNA-binding domain-containing protein [Listeria ivanovii]|uniref:Putative two-component response regulator n=1 Tax=Listeria ivanovii (strain ATCC BAA-678 / PAM 55) TaxID=881621 RepID=G2ZE47_LISIP|nr:LytTR family DNA-binding domain-containing protein [Listeria ivanovii]AHI55485.1 LytR family transcriptional regulator [Listeria ivanovii WSLC3009]AIS64941.1 LytR family transcriptional regulator [Listeria ivanovii subsp. ivanovii]MBK3913220.1 LytTR family transcriptional regulator [Listeria ivanovii subsp. ivanovii]MBK3920663.1 LytTR family transcriptional regulator [Listeria ivanovii subsp. ivanovii]MBK3925511.1 LytTR family transcriptional regulator [Listeria ivanovii subsp. ivanovii]
MRFRVKQDSSAVVGEVELYCHPNDVDKVTNIILNLEEKISVKKDAETYLLEPKVILYFEAVENKIFVYTEKEVYETNWKLYELEERFNESSFFRCSKSMILNIKWIEKVAPGFNGRFEARLWNNEKVIISRQYAKVLKQKLQIGGGNK